MPATPASAHPDASTTEPRAERPRIDALVPRENASSAQPAGRPGAPGGDQDGEPREPAPGAPGQAPSDRAVDADLLIDIPQLSVEDLTLELEASILLNRIKLDAKGLELGLYVKANFDRLAALAQNGGSGTPAGPRTGLRELLGATRDAYHDLSDRDVQQQLRDVHESAREAYEHVANRDEPQEDADGGRASRHGDNGGGGQSHPVRERARHAVEQAVKAAGLTAVGLAGGALLESARSKSSRRKLPIPRRSKAGRVLPHAIAKRLP